MRLYSVCYSKKFSCFPYWLQCFAEISKYVLSSMTLGFHQLLYSLNLLKSFLCCLQLAFHACHWSSFGRDAHGGVIDWTDSSLKHVFEVSPYWAAVLSPWHCNWGIYWQNKFFIWSKGTPVCSAWAVWCSPSSMNCFVESDWQPQINIHCSFLLWREFLSELILGRTSCILYSLIVLAVVPFYHCFWYNFLRRWYNIVQLCQI